MTRCRPPQRKTLPDEPGTYYWTEWAAMVQVYAKTKTWKPGGRLYVRAPGGIEIRVTPRIAGSFLVMTRRSDAQC